MQLCVEHRRLLRGGQLTIMAGTKQMAWHQTPVNHVLYVFDTIPPFPLQSLERACSPQLKYHQLPVVLNHVTSLYVRLSQYNHGSDLVPANHVKKKKKSEVYN